MTEVVEDEPEGRELAGHKVKVLYDHQQGLLTASAESEMREIEIRVFNTLDKRTRATVVMRIDTQWNAFEELVRNALGLRQSAELRIMDDATQLAQEAFRAEEVPPGCVLEVMVIDEGDKDTDLDLALDASGGKGSDSGKAGTSLAAGSESVADSVSATSVRARGRLTDALELDRELNAKEIAEAEAEVAANATGIASALRERPWKDSAIAIDSDHIPPTHPPLPNGLHSSSDGGESENHDESKKVGTENIVAQELGGVGCRRAKEREHGGNDEAPNKGEDNQPRSHQDSNSTYPNEYIDPSQCPLVSLGNMDGPTRLANALPFANAQQWQQVTEQRLHMVRFAPFSGRKGVRLDQISEWGCRDPDEPLSQGPDLDTARAELGSHPWSAHVIADEKNENKGVNEITIGSQDGAVQCCGNFIDGGEQTGVLSRAKLDNTREINAFNTGGGVHFASRPMELDKLETSRVSTQLVAQMKQEIAAFQAEETMAWQNVSHQQDVVADAKMAVTNACWSSLAVVGTLAVSKLVPGSGLKRLSCVCAGSAKAIKQVKAWGLPRSEMLESCDEARLALRALDSERDKAADARIAARTAGHKLQTSLEMLGRAQAPHTLAWRLLFEMRELGGVLTTNSPVWTAVVSDDVEALREAKIFLDDYGHELRALRDAYGCSLLFIAVAAGATRVTRVLIHEYNFDDPSLLNAKRRGDDVTPLWLAVERGHEQCVATLIDAGADVNACDGNDGRSPAFLAMMNSHSGCLRKLVKAGANLNIKTFEGVTPLAYAAAWGLSDWVRILLEAKGGKAQLDVELLGEAGNTAIDWARCAGHDDIVDMLYTKVEGAAWKKLQLRQKQGDIHVGLINA